MDSELTREEMNRLTRYRTDGLAGNLSRKKKAKDALRIITKLKSK